MCGNAGIFDLLSCRKSSVPIKLYLAYVLAVAAFYFGTLPIYVTDTDLWYHLDGGRYYFGHHSIPTTSYFSFLEPPREFANYYWLFQVLVYWLYSHFGYFGLIFLRLAAYVATVYFIARFFLTANSGKSGLFLTFVVLTYFFTLIPRMVMVRPHMFSYLFLAVFIYVLEFYPRRVFILPPLAVLWVNLHGIEYPVMVLVVVAYLIDYYWKHLRADVKPAVMDYRFLVPALLVLLTVYVSPYGVSLVKLPFIPMQNAKNYIVEMRSMYADDFFSITVEKMVPNWLAFFTVLFFMICFMAFISVVRRSASAGRLLMFAGGCYLLTRSYRHAYEFVLLAMPLSCGPRDGYAGMETCRARESDGVTKAASDWDGVAIRRMGRAVAVLTLLVLPVLCYRAYVSNGYKYPFSTRGLPVGVVKFMNDLGVGGRVMNYANSAGFLHWALNPRYKIHMDFQMSLFTDEDAYINLSSFKDVVVFDKFITTYKPQFIIVSKEIVRFREIVRVHPEYVVIFFDDVTVLYVNRKDYPEVAGRYGLDVDPYVLTPDNLKSLPPAVTHALAVKVKHMHDVYPYVLQFNELLGNDAVAGKRFDEAAGYANSIIVNFPELPYGYVLRADVEAHEKRFSGALAFYDKALARAGDKEMGAIYKKIAFCYNAMGNDARAYKVMKRAVNIYDETLTYKELYNLGLMAVSSGYNSEAYTLFKFASFRVPDGDREYAEKIQHELSIFKDREHSRP